MPFLPLPIQCSALPPVRLSGFNFLFHRFCLNFDGAKLLHGKHTASRMYEMLLILKLSYS